MRKIETLMRRVNLWSGQTSTFGGQNMWQVLGLFIEISPYGKN